MLYEILNLRYVKIQCSMRIALLAKKMYGYYECRVMILIQVISKMCNVKIETCIMLCKNCACVGIVYYVHTKYVI